MVTQDLPWYKSVFQLTRLEIENYNQQTETESTIEMNQHLQVKNCRFISFILYKHSFADDSILLILRVEKIGGEGGAG